MEQKELITLRNTIEKMSFKKHIEVFKILKKYNIDYSENSNGIFFNLTEISPNILTEIQDFIHYIEVQESMINEDEDIKKEYEKMIQ